MTAVRQQHSWPRVLAAAIGVLALALRLLPAAPVAADPALALAAAFGEHALCLSGSPPADPASAPGSRLPQDPAGHRGHDTGCCQWHTVAGSVPSRAADPPSRVAFAAPAEHFIAAAPPPRLCADGLALPRGPPHAIA